MELDSTWSEILDYGNDGFLLIFSDPYGSDVYWSTDKDTSVNKNGGMTWKSQYTGHLHNPGNSSYANGMFIVTNSQFPSHISTNKGVSWADLPLPDDCLYFRGVGAAYWKTPKGTNRLMLTGYGCRVDVDSKKEGYTLWSDNGGATWTASPTGDLYLYHLTYVSRP